MPGRAAERREGREGRRTVVSSSNRTWERSSSTCRTVAATARTMLKTKRTTRRSLSCHASRLHAPGSWSALYLDAQKDGETSGAPLVEEEPAELRVARDPARRPHERVLDEGGRCEVGEEDREGRRALEDLGEGGKARRSRRTSSCGRGEEEVSAWSCLTGRESARTRESLLAENDDADCAAQGQRRKEDDGEEREERACEGGQARQRTTGSEAAVGRTRELARVDDGEPQRCTRRCRDEAEQVAQATLEDHLHDGAVSGSAAAQGSSVRLYESLDAPCTGPRRRAAVRWPSESGCG